MKLSEMSTVQMAKALCELAAPVGRLAEDVELLRGMADAGQGKDTLGGVTVKLSSNGRHFSGRGLSTDIIKASIVAYIDATNKMQAHFAKHQEG